MLLGREELVGMRAECASEITFDVPEVFVLSPDHVCGCVRFVDGNRPQTHVSVAEVLEDFLAFYDLNLGL